MYQLFWKYHLIYYSSAYITLSGCQFLTCPPPFRYSPSLHNLSSNTPMDCNKNLCSDGLYFWNTVFFGIWRSGSSSQLVPNIYSSFDFVLNLIGFLSSFCTASAPLFSRLHSYFQKQDTHFPRTTSSISRPDSAKSTPVGREHLWTVLSPI